VKRLRVHIQGAGKVGRGLARLLRAQGAKVTLRAARDGLPPTPLAADVVVLAVRDRDLTPLATELAASGLVPRRAVCVHVAGAQGPEALAPLRAVCAGVAQMHPMIAFATPDSSPTLARGQLHVDGDEAAVRAARQLGKLLGMTPRTLPGMDKMLYHASAGLVANGAAALAALGAELLAVAGVPPELAPRMLGPLLRSVADNVEELGFPAALTGPVRRGDAATVVKQAALLEAKLPSLLGFYLESVAAQLPLARALGEAAPEAFDAIDAELQRRRPPPR
jgi:predicted short-subunit dehydrogenase-like oxidoreductase (DUF2520 family)